MALNLLRNSRVFYTTNLKTDGTGEILTTGFTDTNTREIQVLDGFSFSQNTGQETITTSEAGPAPVRGQRSFNTSLEPVDWSFSTYVRPNLVEGASVSLGTLDADDYVDCEESVLWNSLSGYAAHSIGAAAATTGQGWTTTVGTGAVSTVAFGNSNKHQLHAFGLLIVFDDITFAIDNCAIDSATIDFGLDAIATIAWAGKGTVMRKLGTKITLVDNTTTGISTMSGGVTGTAKLKNTAAFYIANKLSIMELSVPSTYAGITAASPKLYDIALTGGSFTISNNLTYLTPANLGVVNRPITYFTGTRAVTATVNAYLKTGTGINTTATLLSDLLTSSQTYTDNKFKVLVKLGGAGSTRVELDLPTVQLTIPSIASEQVISTSINMTAQGYNSSSSTYDLEQTNEVTVKYYANNSV
jgi:hypothetical protein